MTYVCADCSAEYCIHVRALIERLNSDCAVAVAAVKRLKDENAQLLYAIAGDADYVHPDSIMARKLVAEYERGRHEANALYAQERAAWAAEKQRYAEMTAKREALVAELRALVAELAAGNPFYYGEGCLYCNTATAPDAMHTDACIWRRAREAVR
jgi:porphobilinogen deaminase